jgi:diaminopimelate decarboxylase
VNGVPAGVPAQVAGALAALEPPVCAYVYDRAVLRERAAAVCAALPGALVLYAVKANGHPEIAGTLASTVDGLEVASGGELSLAIGAGARVVSFAGPAKTDRELAAAAGLPALVNVESALELRRLAAVAARPVTALLRVNRASAPPAGSHRMTGTPTAFGIDEAHLPEVVALARDLPWIGLAGFHLHAVSNNLDAGAHAAFIRDAVRWSVGAARRLSVPLRYVNVGGGFGVDYTGGTAFDLDALRAGLSDVDDLLGGARLVVEPGRYLAAAAGWYAAEVLDLKHTHGRWFAVLRGGTHHFRLPAAWGYSHPFTVLPVERWPYPFDRPEVRDVRVDVAGELCTPRDVLARDQPVGRLRVGDVLVFANTGAYGWDISHHDFLRHPHPVTVVL